MLPKKFLTHKRIILIGFMGTGKTKLAQMLAKKLRMRFVDSDSAIVRKERRSIAKIFKIEGENYFRRIESQVLSELTRKDNVVIATGGGSVLCSKNRKLMKRSGLVIWIRSDAKQIFLRVKAKRHRPLVNVRNPLLQIRKLLKLRESYYKNTADLFVINNEESTNKAFRKLEKQLGLDK